MEILSNKLPATTFEASLGCMTVTAYAKRRQQGNRDRTDEDRLCEIDHWAKLFKAKTWEDLRMIAEKNQYMNEAAAEIYMRNADENIREQCLAREEYWKHERWVRNQIEEKDRTIADQKQMIADQKQMIADQNRMIEELRKKLNNQ